MQVTISCVWYVQADSALAKGDFLVFSWWAGLVMHVEWVEGRCTLMVAVAVLEISHLKVENTLGYQTKVSTWVLNFLNSKLLQFHSPIFIHSPIGKPPAICSQIAKEMDQLGWKVTSTKNHTLWWRERGNQAVVHWHQTCRVASLLLIMSLDKPT